MAENTWMNSQITDSVTQSNVKVLGDAPAESSTRRLAAPAKDASETVGVYASASASDLGSLSAVGMWGH